MRPDGRLEAGPEPGEAARRLVILAGGGRVPLEIAEAARAAGRIVSVVALEGWADADFRSFPVARVNLGAIGRMLEALKATGARDLVLSGQVRRPALGALRPDLGTFTSLPRLAGIVSGGDDAVLRRIASFFEHHGFRIVGVGQVAPALLAPEGLVAGPRERAPSAPDVALGVRALSALARYDIGQGLVVRAGRIVGIEGIEGTDALLGRLRAGVGQPRGGVLVKRAKPGQHLALDLPVIGRRTVEGAAAAGLTALALEAGHVIIAERSETTAAAAREGIWIGGLPMTGNAIEPRPEIRWRSQASRNAPSAGIVADAVLGGEVVAVARAFEAGEAVVVRRRHVLAVTAGEPLEEMLARVERHRPWRGLPWSGRSGALVVADIGKVSAGIVGRLRGLGLRGIGSLDGDTAGRHWPAEVLEACRREGIAALALAAAGERRSGP